jgi:hypothetical protein
MATLEQIMQALRNADAAGDTVGAKRLAEMARDAGAASSGRGAAATPPPTQSAAPDLTNFPKVAEYVAGLPGDAQTASLQGVDNSGLAAWEKGLGGYQDAKFASERPVASRAGAVLRGAPFVGSYLDEAAGFIGGPQAQQRAQSMADGFASTNPVQSGALNFAGGVLGALPAAAVAGPTLAAAAPASMLAQAGAGAALGATAGAVEGAIYGAGEGNTDQERGNNALTGGLVGGGAGLVLGAAAPYASAGVKNLIQRLRKSDVKVISRELNVSPEAAGVIRDTLRNGSEADAMAALQRAGPAAMLADAGRPASALLDAAASSGGTASQIAQPAVSARAQAATGKIVNVLDRTLGAPQGEQELINAVRTGSAPARSAAYDAAYAREIDWNSPAGQRLRHLINTTPDEVKSAAARTRSMKVTESTDFRRYADDFPDNVQTTRGPESPITREAEDVDAFFGAYDSANSNFQRRPLTQIIKQMGGVDPDSVAGQELKAMDITSRNTPGLFRKGGLKDLDNLDPSAFPDSIRGQGDGTGNYMNRQTLIDSLAGENNGRAVRSFDDGLDERYAAELERSYDSYADRRAALDGVRNEPDAPPAQSELVPTQTVEDIDAIKQQLDSIYSTNDGGGKLGGQTPAGMFAGRRATAIRDALKEAVPEYGAALDVASDAITERNAIETGYTLLSKNTRREDIARELVGATQAQRNAAKQGVRASIDDAMANVTRTMSDPDTTTREGILALRDMSSRSNTTKLRILLGQDAADELLAEVDEAATAFELRAAIAENSKTAIRQSIQGGVNARAEGGILRTLQTGEPVNAAKRIVQAITGETPEAKELRRMGIYEDIARALTETRGGRAQAALARINAAMNGQTLSEQSARMIANTLTTSSVLVGSQQAQQRLR